MIAPYFKQGGVTLYHGDCRELLPEIETADLVVTDPPYTFGIASTSQEGKSGGWGDLMNSAVWYSSWLTECRRITATRQGAAWVFNSWRSFPVLARASHDCRWPITSLLVWDKEWIGPGGPKGLRACYELVALFSHDGFSIDNRALPDVWRAKWTGHKPNGHPAEKPTTLLQRLITESGGGLVLDPYCGSGSTLVAAKNVGAQAIGIEIEERWCEVAATRLSQGALDFAPVSP